MFCVYSSLLLPAVAVFIAVSQAEKTREEEQRK